MADRLGVDAIGREGRIVVLKFRPQAKVDPVRLVALVRQRPELTLVPPAALKLDLQRAQGEGLRAHEGRSSSPLPSALSPRKGSSRSSAQPSWWTARARA